MKTLRQIQVILGITGCICFTAISIVLTIVIIQAGFSTWAVAGLWFATGILYVEVGFIIYLTYRIASEPKYGRNRQAKESYS